MDSAETRPPQLGTHSMAMTQPQRTKSSEKEAPRNGPSKSYYAFDVLVKLLMAGLLLGILIVLAIVLAELKKSRQDIQNLLGRTFDVSLVDSVLVSPLDVSLVGLDLDQFDDPVPVSFGNSINNPLYVETVD
ncbi:hypothetical protein FALCPG4_015454 [Fusarium falciforme]